MTNRIGVKSVAPKPEPNGSRVVTVYAFGAGDVDIVFSEAEAVRLVRMFQQGFLERRGQMSAHPDYPVLSVTDASLAHGQVSTGLLLETAEMGSLVLTFNAPIASRMKAEIDAAVSANDDRKRKN